jgi:cysteinyl-tRNA synthetase
LLVEGRKMSKSLGNFFTLRDLLAKGFTGRDVRFLLLKTHYRETFNFTIDGLHGAKASLSRIDECVGKLREIAGSKVAGPDTMLLVPFSAALADDLNVSAAWAVVFDWVRETNKRLTDNAMDADAAAASLAAWEKVDTVLGVGAKARTEEIPAEIAALLEARQAARKAKDFKQSDTIRDELKARAWVIEDTPKGPKLKRV